MESEYDILFLGMGAANSLLLLQLHQIGALRHYSVAILEPDGKKANDRTFCFWATPAELQQLHLEELVSHSWGQLAVSGAAPQSIAPLRYYHIRGIDLYDKVREVLAASDVHVHRRGFEGPPVVTETGYALSVGDEKLTARWVFDSRPTAYAPPKQYQTHLFQSFLGWQIKTEAPVVDPQTATMMDFEVEQGGFTQFVYLLPFDAHHALVELTRFGSEIIEPAEGTKLLNAYVRDRIGTYSIQETESGVIPMSTAAIQAEVYGDKWVPMGSRAGMIKPSTGYAFKAMAEHAVQMTRHLTAADPPPKATPKEVSPARFRFYDRLLLNILKEKPHYGKPIFEQLFQRVPLRHVLYFLQERTTLLQDAKLLLQLPKLPFLRAAVKEITCRSTELPVSRLPILLTLLFLIFSASGLGFANWGLLAAGFLLLGLPHGALDHLLEKQSLHSPPLLLFTLQYLLKGTICGLLWWWQPEPALLFFIGYSAWHFGQADFREWGSGNHPGVLFWGLCVLLALLFTHREETQWILTEMRNERLADAIAQSPPLTLAGIVVVCGAVAALSAGPAQLRGMLLTLTYLLLASWLPLLMAFGVYFVYQHSVNGWKHILTGLNTTSAALWKKATPFTLGALGFLLLFCGARDQWSGQVGNFFIFLSCLSFPHVVSMHHFYTKKPH